MNLETATRARADARNGARRHFGLTCSIVIAALLPVAGSPVFGVSLAQDAPLIPRRVFFGNPDHAAPQISSDGSHLAWLAPDEGVLNVWVAPTGDLDAAKPVTADRKRGIRSYFWAYTNRHIIYTQDEGGDENWRVYVTDIATGETRDLTPFDAIRGPDGEPLRGPTGRPQRPAARIVQVSARFPESILIALNLRDPRFHDLYRVNILTGDLTQIEENTQGFVGYVTDDDYAVRFALRMEPDGANTLLKRDQTGAWKTFLAIPAADALTTGPAGFSKDGRTLYLTDSRDRNTAALVALDLDDGRIHTLAEDPRADVRNVLIHPSEYTVQAASFLYDRLRWRFLDERVAADFDRLGKVIGGDVTIVSRTHDDAQWIVSSQRDDAPATYYRFDRASGAATRLFSSRTALDGRKLARMHPEIITSRDGLRLVSYLSLPPGADGDGDARPERALPMVLLVHGGPWARDVWGYNPLHQWLANRGYAVLSVNFRGSTGFGKNFINAANGEWAGRMHDDLIDAVRWAIDAGVADPKRVAIMGGSYGGYATLVGLTFTPDVFACGVDIVGPSNLVTLLKSIPPYWTPMIELFTQRIGDHRTEEGRSLLEKRSPLTYVKRIRKPLLIGQGANDPRVKQAESDQIVRAMQENKIPVTYVLYPDEGHGFARPANRLAFFAVAEAFLAEHLGGRCEPIGNDFDGSSIQIPAGAEQIPGLADQIRLRTSRAGD
ncbi:MAG: S9 family peptidase [Planctomycetota bacterium]|nr:MAG: S9 family peptidase [Planctomycetota bacterium]